MNILKSVVIIYTIASLTACNNRKTEPTVEVTAATPVAPAPITLSKSENIINETIKAHGGKLYETARYQFVFRDQIFQFKNDSSHSEYIKTYKKGDATIVDILKNGIFSRRVNEKPIELSEKAIASASESINSVIYFATLPHKLNDAAVNSRYIKNTVIKGKNYGVIEVTFNQEGGGKDHDDEYYYWINSTTKKIDYLAYNYSVNNGGVRFRVAYNKRVVKGITFQDYVNYEAPVGTALIDLPTLFEANQLKELSKIETENVVALEN